jgi:hypothetical protein
MDDEAHNLASWDPAWQRHFADAHAELSGLLADRAARPSDSSLKAPIETALARLHGAFMAQFRTREDFRTWVCAYMRARQAENGIALSDEDYPPPGSTMGDIRAAWRQCADALDREIIDAQHPFAEQPAGLAAFSDAGLPLDIRPWIVRHEAGSVSALVLTEHMPDQANVCIAITEHPVSVPLAQAGNVAATRIYRKHLQSRYTPQQVSFFVYLPWHIHQRHDQFFRMDMSWGRLDADQSSLLAHLARTLGLSWGQEGYLTPGWTAFTSLPDRLSRTVAEVAGATTPP